MKNTKLEKLINHIKEGASVKITQTANSILKDKVLKTISEKKLEISKNLFNK